ncbi:glycosyltransferase family 4 protein [Streptomyces leeuwenhoekii]|uniref:D-inositol 3-phosphate glycosyltransferase n=1 Tax=Streptomyces leeuwenhoekii TaxID=1437453 RepID=A0A0F7W4Z8_STRLW|nr:glycosyltransferase family 4 protein [Streptomyces leeuwenhoekii]KMS75673.1 UDP-glucose:polyglycerol phosphate glucosyltransferase [Streptomyces leeuwenhoekii]CQR64101.1 Exopolysaccharide phosphotransferase SCO2592 [Streptomyces leeuwenhoekii]
MKIAFLVRDLCHMGGVVSATQNLAGALADRHEVEIVALRKVRDESYFPLDPRVSVRVLSDLRPHSPVSDLDDPLVEKWPLVYPPNTGAKKPVVSRLAERRLLEYLATTDADVVVSSSPRNTIMLAQAPGTYLKVAQEHSMPSIYAKDIKERLFPAYLSLDALTALTPEEVESIGRQVPAVRDRLAVMPNCVPASPIRSKGTNKVVVCAGHLTDNKNHALLVEAFAKVHAQAPDWTLRIYGSGAEKARLRARIEELGLSNSILLMGQTAPVTPEFGKGSIFVLPSKREAFGNVIVEAMAAGLPVVSTDADHGPRNILTPGEDGLLVPRGDVEEMARAILRLVQDDELRQKMAANAVRGAERFHETASRERFEAILERALARKALPRHATARVDDRGSVHIEVGPLPERARGAELVLRRSGKNGEEHRFPLSDSGEALVAWDAGLPHGTWEAALASPSGGEVPLTTDGYGCDTRDLLAVELPRPHGHPLALLLPHRHDDGRLRVRSALRAVHAEVGPVRVDDQAVRLRAELWGATLGRGAVVEAVHRRDKERVLTFEARDAGDGAFEAVVDCAALAREHGEEDGKEAIWDFWIRPEEGAPRAALAKLATDVLKPIDVFTFPRPVLTSGAVARPSVVRRAARRARRSLGATPAALPRPVRTELRPYYTALSQFAVKTVRL